MKSNQEEKSHTFKRNFEHIDGNWPSHIYLNVKISRRLRALIYAALTSFNTLNHKGIEYLLIKDDKIHISLSRPFVLRHHQISSFIGLLHSSLHTVLELPIILEIDPHYFLLTNEECTRKFICIPLNDPQNYLLKLISKVDSILTQFRQKLYYENPLFHISIASFRLTDQTSRSDDDCEVKRPISYQHILQGFKTQSSSDSNLDSDEDQDDDGDGDDQLVEYIESCISTQKKATSGLTLTARVEGNASSAAMPRTTGTGTGTGMGTSYLVDLGEYDVADGKCTSAGSRQGACDYDMASTSTTGAGCVSESQEVQEVLEAANLSITAIFPSIYCKIGNKTYKYTKQRFQEI